MKEIIRKPETQSWWPARRAPGCRRGTPGATSDADRHFKMELDA